MKEVDDLTRIVDKYLEEEYEKCKKDPHYFATKYITVSFNGAKYKFTTRLSKEEFNNMFFKLQKVDNEDTDRRNIHGQGD